MLWTVYSAQRQKPSKARPPSLEIARNRTDRGCTQPYRPRRTPAPGRPWANSRCSCRIGRSALAPPTLVVPDVCLLLYASFQAGTDVITLAPKAEHFRRPFCSSCAVASRIRPVCRPLPDGNYPPSGRHWTALAEHLAVFLFYGAAALSLRRRPL